MLKHPPCSEDLYHYRHNCFRKKLRQLVLTGIPFSMSEETTREGRKMKIESNVLNSRRLSSEIEMGEIRSCRQFDKTAITMPIPV